MKRPPAKEMTRMKEELYRDLVQGTIGIRQATRRMRKILGMTQKEYAQKVADISPRILSEFENGSGNPTLATSAMAPVQRAMSRWTETVRRGQTADPST